MCHETSACFETQCMWFPEQAPGQNQAQDKANLAKSKRTKKMKSTKVVKLAGRVKDAGLSHIKHAQ